MPATKSKGPGTLLLVIILLLAVAGGSAWFIHSMLSGEDPLGGGTPAANNGGEAGSGTSGSPGSQSGPVVLSGSVPEATLPGGLPIPQPGAAPVQTGQEDGDQPGVPGAAPEGLPETGQPGPYAQTDQEGDPNVTGEPGGETTRNLLLVPGAIAEPAPAAREDAVVRPAFINDIAAFLAQNYWPRNAHPSARRSGITTVSLRWANLRYGAELQGLEGRGSDPARARSAVLGYVLHPGMVSRLYDLYADGFVSALAHEADRRSVGEDQAKRLLTTPEKKEMFTIYSGYATRVSAALDRYAADGGMAARVVAYSEAEQAVQEANRAYMESTIAFEEAEEGDNKSAAEATRLRRDKDAATYQKRIREREAKRDVLVTAMSRDKNPRASGSDTLVYVAFWAYRRGPDSAPALQACAKALADMSAKLTDAAKQFN